MFGGKLRSWMEAVRPRKKQHRKDKPMKNNASIPGSEIKCVTKIERSDNSIILPNDFKEHDTRDVIASNASKNQNNSQPEAAGVSNSRYSANNLSSPESAYSTGYSTDGTSPGAPPEYLLNNPTKHPDRYNLQGSILNSTLLPNSPRSRTENSCTTILKNSSELVSNHFNAPRTPILQTREHTESKIVAAQIEEIIGGPKSPSIGLTSPRQRNRIRTNPWLPSSIPSPIPTKHEINKTTVPSKINRDSPRSRRFLSPVVSRRHSLSSSSCSSLSGTSISLEPPRARSASDDEDCTLNEMMGKYDESYVYEKETDILSDSDPTDCETDIDTGQDGGDEDDPFEGELDFIDNGSHLDFDPRLDHNTGHCSYYNFDVTRKRSSRRKTTRRSSKQGDKKRRSSSNKKRHLKQLEGEKVFNGHLDGSKSAGATPLSSRRAGHRLVSKLALEECLKKRSNSVSFYRNQITTIDKRDKEADLKYKELITEAEQILRTMKTNGLSPRRLPGPANKRVELLRNTECSKIDVFGKNRPGFNEDNVMDSALFPKIPSSNFNCSRFSPKKSHITNFLISNSPVLVRKEWEHQNEMFKPHLSNRKKKEDLHCHKSILHEEKNVDAVRISPRHKRHVNKNRVANSSSDSDDELEKPFRNSIMTGCPQSEPVRRKVYFGHTTINNPQKPQKKGKTVAFNLSREVNDYMQSKSCRTSSTENLRQQVLLNTIVNLKRNLEDQSASLKQVYRSSHNIYV